MLGASAPIKRLVWRRSYDLLARRYPDSALLFMNYGYVPLPAEASPELRPEDEGHRLSIQLYHRTVRAVDLRGRDILEVGCGRGGGIAYLQRYHAPRRIVGLDLSARAVALCRRDHTGPGMAFLAGNAETLPFRDAAFDAVVNVESSHCYGAMARFLAEVRRVLRPGGHLLLADLRTGSSVAALFAELGAAGLALVSADDISSGVLAALTRDSGRREMLIRARVPRVFRRLAAMFAGVNGTPMFEWLRSGRARYLCCILRKAPAAR